MKNQLFEQFHLKLTASRFSICRHPMEPKDQINADFKIKFIHFFNSKDQLRELLNSIGYEVPSNESSNTYERSKWNLVYLI